MALYHLVVENTSTPNDYPLTLGPYEWYLIIHGFGGLIYEAGQVMQDGLVGYCTDPWNVIDICMYAFLSLWLIFRISESSMEREILEDGKWAPLSGDVPTDSTDYLGLAGIFIWVRLLNVFGLDPTFGPLVLIIQGMCKQVVVFLILLAVFLAGFGACMR